MTAASPADLAAQLGQHHAALEEARYRLDRLIRNLEEGDGYFVDHAEEHLGFIADALRGTSVSLDSLKRYTVTGAARIAAYSRD